jgi:hypothetical protein
MKYSKFILLLTWIIIGFQNNINAQPKIENSVLSNGCKAIYGNNIEVNSTFGQSIIGIINNSNHFGYCGFWYQSGITNITNVEQLITDLLPKEYSLEQNYPNPFNPATTIQFSLPKQAFVTLRIYDILGKEINILLNDDLQPGEYKVNFDAEYLASGIYFYQLNSKEFVKVRKMMLVH